MTRLSKVWEDRQKHHLSVSGRRGTGKGHVREYAVRSVADPRFAPLIGRGYADAVRRDGKGRSFQGDDGEVKAAKAWAKLYGYKGAGGGWIYGPDRDSRPVTQGWGSFAIFLKRQGRIAEGADGKWYVIDRELVK